MAYMFVFSSNMEDLSQTQERFYSALEEVPKQEYARARIYPVKFSESDYDHNLWSEEIRYENGGWVPDWLEWDESWLRIILADPIEELEVLTTDVSHVIIYEETAFHCMSDLIQYMISRKDLTIAPIEGMEEETEEPSQPQGLECECAGM